MMKHICIEMQALLSAARTANSPTVRRSFAQATAAVAKTASETRAAKLVADAVQLYSDPGTSLLLMALWLMISVIIQTLQDSSLKTAVCMCFVSCTMLCMVQETRCPGSWRGCC